MKENVVFLLSFPILSDRQSAYFSKYYVWTIVWSRILNISRLELLRNRLAVMQLLKIYIFLTIQATEQAQRQL